MSELQLQLVPEEIDVATKDTSYVLQQLEVFNWGPFRGLHRAEFDPNGTAIIGPTGSGKTTLVDALMTLLVGQPRYNLASTGGHESDRTLISYVRGVLGGDGSDGREEVARPGKTITAICATYRGGAQKVRLAGLLWTDGASNAADDLRRRWLFSLADEQSLEQWLRLLHDDGIRDLMRTGRETAGLRIFESKKAYIAHLRKFFDVGENAFTLLNRAAGLKQLNSIDEIFRELVLDDRSKFERALEVAAEFYNLEAIHAELVTAQRQQESLVPIADEHQRLLKTLKKVDRFRALKRIVPIWFAIMGRDKWSEVMAQLAKSRESLEMELAKEREKARSCEARVDTLRQRYLELGGDVIGELEKTIAVQRERVKEKSKHAVHYRNLLKPFNLSDELSAESLRRNQAWLGDHREETEKLHDRKHETTLAAFSQQRELETSLQDAQSMLRKVQDRPGSNIPPPFQDFRAELAAELSLRAGDLPFLAELVEVRPDESAWRGAIERAIGSERLRVLVPDDRIDSALQWVNDRNNRLHVRLQRADQDKSSATSFTDGYTRKLNFKSHPLAETAKALLASRDLHCVASPAALKTTELALTMQGTMSGRHGKFEKHDQRRLDQDWMTGFNNKDQLEALASQLDAAQKALELSHAESQKHRQELARLAERLKIIDDIARLEFSEIDLPGAEAELSYSEERIAALLDPKSDASQAKALYDAENRVLESMREDISQRQNEIAVLESQHDHAEQERDKADERIGAGLSDDEMSLGKAHLAVSPNVVVQQLDVEERRLTTDVESKLNKQVEAVTTIELELVRLMGKARQVDTGALADTGSEIQDIEAYLERLRVLNEEALPEKRGRFLDYLNRSSDQGVTQLLAGINEEVDIIEQRIHDLNQTLVKVDFRSGRYLQLQPQRIKDERLRALDTAVRKVRAAALKDDGGETHYKALQEMVGILRQAGENPRQQGSRALLDPRFRLQFFVVEVDRQTGDRSPPRSGSQSGSGGEKELMASHILTASLSYALCPPEANCPLYGTVVLDEAFSKSSPSAAARIIEALRIFRLHAIFVTPNKEIGLLKQHTQKVVCVQRPGKEASLASISWEKLEELARPK
jgi:uncharacterized protein YPO0396